MLYFLAIVFAFGLATTAGIPAAPTDFMTAASDSANPVKPDTCASGPDGPQPPYSPSNPQPYCQVCMGGFNTAGCQGIRENTCYAVEVKEECAATSNCEWTEMGHCVDINTLDCASSAQGLQGCYNYTTNKWKESVSKECEAQLKNCQQCSSGGCKTPEPPTPGCLQAAERPDGCPCQHKDQCKNNYCTGKCQTPPQGLPTGLLFKISTLV